MGSLATRAHLLDLVATGRIAARQELAAEVGLSVQAQRGKAKGLVACLVASLTGVGAVEGDVAIGAAAFGGLVTDPTGLAQDLQLTKGQKAKGQAHRRHA